jgi:hypothetical protein
MARLFHRVALRFPPCTSHFHTCPAFLKTTCARHIHLCYARNLTKPYVIPLIFKKGVRGSIKMNLGSEDSMSGVKLNFKSVVACRHCSPSRKLMRIIVAICTV